MSKLSPEARALWFVLKYSATEPSSVEDALVTYLMQFHQSGAIFSEEACMQNTGLTETDLQSALAMLELKDAIFITRNASGSKQVQVNFEFNSPLFGGVR